MRHFYFVVLIGIFVVVVYVGFLIKKQINEKVNEKMNKNEKKETFVELNDRTRKHIREKKGMEKCGALFLETPSMPKEDYLTMTHFVNGLRLRKWKPNKEDDYYPHIKADKEYCYMYNDELNETQDALLKSNQNGIDFCTKDNPLFDTPLVTNVFNSDFRDRVHNVPIRKCVFELDKNLLKDEKLVTDFWKNWKRQDCLSLEQNLRQKLSNDTEGKDALLRTQKIKQDEYVGKSNDLGIVKHDLFNCRLKKKEIELEIEKTKASLEEYTALYTKEAESLDNIKGEIRTLNQKIKELQEKEEELKNRYETFKNDYEICQNNNLPECQRRKQVIERENEFIEKQLQELRNQVDQLRQELKLRLDLLNRRKADLMVCERELTYLTNKLNELKPEYERINEELQTCESEKDELKKDYESYKETYEIHSNVYYECVNEKNILNERLDLCQNKVEKCVNDVHNMIENIESDFEEIASPDTMLETFVDEENNTTSTDYFSVNWKETQPYFDNFKSNVDKLRRNTNEKSGQLDKCNVENKGILEDIEELRQRGSDLRQRIGKLENEKREDLGRSFGGITQDQTEANKELRASLMNLTEENIRDKINRGCASDEKDLETELETVSHETEQLESRLKQITDKQENTCASDCDISIEQCMIHKGHEEICGGIYIDRPQDDSEETQVDATFDVYDQTNQKIQTIHFTNHNQKESVSITGASEIKFVEFNNNNPKSQANFRIAGVTGYQGKLCPNERFTREPYIKLNIEPSTTFRKVHIYRGITCVHMSS